MSKTQIGGLTCSYMGKYVDGILPISMESLLIRPTDKSARKKSATTPLKKREKLKISVRPFRRRKKERGLQAKFLLSDTSSSPH